jgi:hypothetical protein
MEKGDHFRVLDALPRVKYPQVVIEQKSGLCPELVVSLPNRPAEFKLMKQI